MMTAYTAVLGRQAVIIVTNCKYPTFLAFTQEKRMVSLLNFCLLKNMNFKPLKNNKIEINEKIFRIFLEKHLQERKKVVPLHPN
ncbi:hypothetical protein [Capnocytophaga gingivalis]|jgi:hypothetical protein|uniref:hypothetical protein n=1 Tax=Capnocytophaga gingivalis TaxID=1017 RepID=UPI0028E8BBA9|nr:hypothetical protein [Capnocytophaga gingivalis]